MRRTGRKKEWSIALFCVAFIFIFPPVLSIYNSPNLIFGLPVAYVVLYGGWGLLIVAMAYGARRKTSSDGHGDSHSTKNKHQGDH
jgi:hypothetical protein